jgi:hypothetical protein
MSVAGAPTLTAERKESTRTRSPRLRRLPTRVAFPELVWAHHLRQEQLDGQRPYHGEAEERYRRFESAFEARYGELVCAYWSTATASGAAVTVRRRPGMMADHVRLHWATDWATREEPRLDELLHECEALAVRICEVLRDTSQRVAMQWLFTVVSHVLGFAEADAAKKNAAVAEVVETQRAELRRIEAYYHNAAVRSGQIVYLAGALLGIVAPVGLAILVWVLGFVDTTGTTTRTGFVCFAAGAIGALVSVMARMNSGRVAVDWEFGKDTLRTMGSLRPVVGAIFGLAAYFAFKSGLVDFSLNGNQSEDNFYFYVLIAFIAGFSERFAQDMLLGSTLQRITGKETEGPHHHAAPHDAVPAGPRPAG